MALTDLKRTAKEVKEDRPECCPTTKDKAVAEYPYGLRLRLEDEELEKLGLSVGDFSQDQDLTLTAHAKVRERNENTFDSEGGKTKHTQMVELQVTKLDLNVKAKGNSVADFQKKRNQGFGVIKD